MWAGQIEGKCRNGLETGFLDCKSKTPSKSSSTSKFCIKSKSTNPLICAPLLSSSRIFPFGKQIQALQRVNSSHLCQGGLYPLSHSIISKVCIIIHQALTHLPLFATKTRGGFRKKGGREISLSSPHFQSESSRTFVTYIKPAWVEIHNEIQRKKSFSFPYIHISTREPLCNIWQEKKNNSIILFLQENSILKRLRSHLLHKYRRPTWIARRPGISIDFVVFFLNPDSLWWIGKQEQGQKQTNSNNNRKPLRIELMAQWCWVEV